MSGLCYLCLVSTDFSDLFTFTLQSLHQCFHLTLQILPQPIWPAGLDLSRQLLVFTDTHTLKAHVMEKLHMKTKSLNFFAGEDDRHTNTHKLMCPNSSCNISSRSDSSSLLEEAELLLDWCAERLLSLVEQGGGVCPSTRSLQSWGWWCFMRWRTCWTFARTEWLELVDWREVSQSRYSYKNRPLDFKFKF